MEKKEIFAKIVRTVFVPPVMVTALILVLLVARKGVISSGAETAAAILFLGIVPVLAYPAQHFMPCYKDAGREGQRKLAFLFSLAGYALALASGIVLRSGRGMMLVFFTYFISVLLLTFCNAVLKIRASGHMCSITGPMALLAWFFDWKVLIPCILLFILVAWSSVLLKRHTVQEIVFGGCVGVMGFFFSILASGLCRG